MTAVAPLAASSILTLWSRLWNGQLPGAALSPRFHSALLAVQGTVSLGVLMSGNKAWVTALVMLYAAMGMGVLVLRWRRGAVECGCWGRSTQRLSVRLAAFDFLMAFVAVAGFSRDSAAVSPVAGVFAALLLVASALFLLLWVHEYRWVYAAIRDRAENYREAVLGFPSLRNAT